MNLFPNLFSGKSRRRLTALLLVGAMLVLLAGCGGGSKSEPIRIGCKNMPEQMILQEILAQLIEAKTDLEVERIEPIAGSNLHVAMENDEIDLYPEYTGTGWLTILKHEPTADADYLYENLVKEYEENYDMRWVALYGFENTYTLAVRPETAAQYNLHTISDLAAVSDQLIFGANFDYFEREDGYDALCAAYGLRFKDTAEVDMGLKYQTLMDEKCDVINAYTTDSEIAAYGLVTLADDRKFFTDYRCATVVRNAVLEAHPELLDVLNLMENLISNDEMVQMNYALNTEHRLEADIAAEFLQSKGLLE